MSTPISTEGLNTQVSLTQNTPTKVPTSTLSGRVMLKVLNQSSGSVIYWGTSSAVSEALGFPIAPGEESVWIPTSAQIWLFTTGTGVTALAVEFA